MNILLSLLNEKSRTNGEAVYHVSNFLVVDTDTQETLYKVSAQKTVYRPGDEPIFRFEVYPVDRDSFLPSIYFHDDLYGQCDPRFEIQTTSYGAMRIEKYDEVIRCMMAAKETAIVLTEKFIKEEFLK